MQIYSNKWKISIFIFVIIVCLSSSVHANVLPDKVTLSRCVDGDTAVFNVNGKEEKTRFLAIDTPEYTKEKEEYGKEASSYVCSALNDAETITLEYEEDNQRDKYDRLLAWVFVDGELLQANIVENGLAEVKYVYGDYKYTDVLYEKQEIAKKAKVNLWSGKTPLDYEKIIIIAFCVIGIIVTLLSKKGSKKRKINKYVNTIKKNIK